MAFYEVYGGGPDDGRRLGLACAQQVGDCYIVSANGLEYLYRVNRDDDGTLFFLLERTVATVSR